MKNLALIIVCLLLLLSCGPYSFSGKTITGIKSVYIPVFDNETIEYGLGEELTNKVTDAIVADNTLRVVDREAADAILNATVTSFERTSEIYNIEDQVQEYRVTLAIQARFVKADGELVWEEPRLTAFGLYDAQAETLDDGKTEALEKIAEVIVNRTVRDW